MDSCIQDGFLNIPGGFLYSEWFPYSGLYSMDSYGFCGRSHLRSREFLALFVICWPRWPCSDFSKDELSNMPLTRGPSRYYSNSIHLRAAVTYWSRLTICRNLYSWNHAWCTVQQGINCQIARFCINIHFSASNDDILFLLTVERV